MNSEVKEMIEKYLKWRELVSQSLNDSPEKFMQRVHLLNEVDELAKRFKNTMIPETNNQLVELQKKYDRLLQFHNNAMEMWRNENPANTEMELAVLKTLLRDCVICGADMTENTITVKMNTPNSAVGIVMGGKAKILIEK